MTYEYACQPPFKLLYSHNFTFFQEQLSHWLLITLHSFIHRTLYCIVLYLSISIALLTASAFQKHSRPQQLALCRSLHAKELQASASEGLAQALYVAARAGFEPMTLRSKGIDTTNAPPCPTHLYYTNTC